MHYRSMFSRVVVSVRCQILGVQKIECKCPRGRVEIGRWKADHPVSDKGRDDVESGFQIAAQHSRAQLRFVGER